MPPTDCPLVLPAADVEADKTKQPNQQQQMLESRVLPTMELNDPDSIDRQVSDSSVEPIVKEEVKPVSKRTRRGHRTSTFWWSLGKDFEVNVSRKWFRFYWVLFVMIYLMEGLYLAGVSQLYYWMLYQPVVMLSIQEELHLLPIRTLRAMVWVFPVLAVGHFASVLEPIVYSIQRRQLALSAPKEPSREAQQAKDDLPTAAAAAAAKANAKTKLTIFTKAIPALEALLIKWVYPFVDFDGRHFAIWYAILKTGQIASQTYQCYSLSRLVMANWMNELAVFVTFCNCVSSPVVRYFVPKDIPRQRFLTVLVDSCLAFIQAVVIPCILFYPYYHEYDTGIHYFPDTLAYSYVWYIEALHNLDQIFIVSYLDFFATALPHLDLLRSLREISQWLCTSDHRAIAYMRKPSTPATDKRSSAPSQSGDSSSSRQMLSKSRRKLPVSRVHGVLCTIHGLLIVVIHFASKNRDAIAAKYCLSRANPWFTKHFACSLININCYRSGIHGTSSEITMILQRFDAPSTSELVFSHCPALEMPPILGDFAALVGLDIFNSTLVKWSSEAEVNEHSHPFFNYVIVTESNLSGIPEGLLGERLPFTFNDVEFAATNLSSLPTDIGFKWSSLNTLYLEFCQLKELPKSLGSMPLWYFSAVGNHIEWIDDNMFENDTFSQVLFHRNPLRKLPASIGDLTHVCALTLEYTQIQDVPQEVVNWALNRLDHGLYVAHSMFGTPFCENATATTMDEDPRRSRYTAWACDVNTAMSKGYVPISTISAQLPL